MKYEQTPLSKKIGIRRANSSQSLLNVLCLLKPFSLVLTPVYQQVTITALCTLSAHSVMSPSSKSPTWALQGLAGDCWGSKCHHSGREHLLPSAIKYHDRRSSKKTALPSGQIYMSLVLMSLTYNNKRRENLYPTSLPGNLILFILFPKTVYLFYHERLIKTYIYTLFWLTSIDLFTTSALMHKVPLFSLIEILQNINASLLWENAKKKCSYWVL